MTAWNDWNWINVFLIFTNLGVAIWCFNRGDDRGGHINMAAVLINGLLVAMKVTA